MELGGLLSRSTLARFYFKMPSRLLAKVEPAVTRGEVLELNIRYPFYLVYRRSGARVEASFGVGNVPVPEPMLREENVVNLDVESEPATFIESSDIVGIVALLVEKIKEILSVYPSTHESMIGDYHVYYDFYKAGNSDTTLLGMLIRKKDLTPVMDASLILKKGVEERYWPPRIELVQRGEEGIAPNTFYALRLDSDIQTRFTINKPEQYTVTLHTLTIYSPSDSVSLLRELPPSTRAPSPPAAEPAATVIEEESQAPVPRLGSVALLSGGSEISDYRYYKGFFYFGPLIEYLEPSLVGTAEYRHGEAYVPGLDDTVPLILRLGELHGLLTGASEGGFEGGGALVAYKPRLNRLKLFIVEPETALRYPLLDYEEDRSKLLCPGCNIEREVLIVTETDFRPDAFVDTSLLEAPLLAIVGFTPSKEAWENKLRFLYSLTMEELL